MSAAVETSPTYNLPGNATIAFRRRQLSLYRAMGVGVGIFLVAWGPLSYIRWVGSGPEWSKFQALFYTFFGLLLLLPYSRIRSAKIWKRAALALAVLTVILAFVLVFDVLYMANLYADNGDQPAANTPAAQQQQTLYTYDDDSGQRLPIPLVILNCALAFLAFGQAPVIYFSRHPEQMD